MRDGPLVQGIEGLLHHGRCLDGLEAAADKPRFRLVIGAHPVDLRDHPANARIPDVEDVVLLSEVRGKVDVLGCPAKDDRRDTVSVSEHDRMVPGRDDVFEPAYDAYQVRARILARDHAYAAPVPDPGQDPFDQPVVRARRAHDVDLLPVLNQLVEYPSIEACNRLGIADPADVLVDDETDGACWRILHSRGIVADADLAAMWERFLADDHVGGQRDVVQAERGQAIVAFLLSRVDLRAIRQLLAHLLHEGAVVPVVPVEGAEALRHQDDLLAVATRNPDGLQQKRSALLAPARAERVAAGIEDGVGLAQRPVHLRDLAVPLVAFAPMTDRARYQWLEKRRPVQVIFEDAARVVVIWKDIEFVLIGVFVLVRESDDLVGLVDAFQRLQQGQKHGLRALVSHLDARHYELLHHSPSDTPEQHCRDVCPPSPSPPLLSSLAERQSYQGMGQGASA